MCPQEVQIFLSYSKQDKETSKKFDQITAREDVAIIKSEYETLKTQPWQNIKEDLRKSKALILLIGPKMIATKSRNGEEWSHINGWIGYEVGIALALDLDVWEICDNNVTVNFPVPYVNNYSLGIETKSNGYEAKVIRGYAEGTKFEFGYSKSRMFYCPNKACGGRYNLHNVLQKGAKIVCPMCQRVLTFPNGWQL